MGRWGGGAGAGKRQGKRRRVLQGQTILCLRLRPVVMFLPLPTSVRGKDLVYP